MDPQNQFASPYLAMGNNPVMMVDPDGELAFLAAIAIGAAISGTGYTASVAFSKGGFDNWNWGQFGKSVAIGAVSGAATAGIGSAFGGVGGTASTFGGKVLHEVGRAAAHGYSNMMVGAAFGQTPSLSSFAAGSLGSLMGSATHSLGAVAQIGGSSLVGGIGAELNGGDFWKGAAVGAMVAGLNHVAHQLQDPPAKSGKYGKSGKLVDIHRVVRQKNGYTTYADKRGHHFSLDPNGEIVTNSLFSYFPGGKNFHETYLAQSKLGIYFREHFTTHLDNALWFFGPKMPHGAMPGQPYFGPGIPTFNPDSNTSKRYL